MFCFLILAEHLSVNANNFDSSNLFIFSNNVNLEIEFQKLILFFFSSQIHRQIFWYQKKRKDRCSLYSTW
jgi:hypothetical protein